MTATHDPTRNDLIAAIRRPVPLYGHVVWHPHDGRYLQLNKTDVIASLREAFEAGETVKAWYDAEGTYLG